MYHFHIISALVLRVIPRIQSELAIKWLNTLVPSYCLRRNMNVVIKENIAGLHYKGTVFGLDSKEETHFSSWKKLRYFSLLTLRDIYMYMLIDPMKTYSVLKQHDPKTQRPCSELCWMRSSSLFLQATEEPAICQISCSLIR